MMAYTFEIQNWKFANIQYCDLTILRQVAKLNSLDISIL